MKYLSKDIQFRQHFISKKFPTENRKKHILRSIRKVNWYNLGRTIFTIGQPNRASTFSIKHFLSQNLPWWLEKVTSQTVQFFFFFFFSFCFQVYDKKWKQKKVITKRNQGWFEKVLFGHLVWFIGNKQNSVK